MVSRSIDRLFTGVAPATRSAVAAARRRRDVAPGADLLAIDTMPDQLIHLLDGRARVWRPMADGRALLLYFLGPGEVAGMVPTLRGRPGPAAITAVTAIEAECWPAPLFRALLDADPVFAGNVARLVADRFAMVVDRMADMTGGRVDQHLARALLRLAGDEGEWTAREHVTVPVTRQDLADMSGTTLTTASRTLSQWGEDGLIESTRGQVTLVDPHRLAELADLTA